MFAYCLNNPVNYVDENGANSDALQWWISTMWWLCGVDTVLPFGDIIFTAGVVLYGAQALSMFQMVETLEISVEEEKTSTHMSKEHTKGARESTREKHQRGQTRKNRDNRGEKGDARRYYKGNKKKLKMLFLTAGDLLHEDESTQVVTSGGLTSPNLGKGDIGVTSTVYMPY